MLVYLKLTTAAYTKLSEQFKFYMRITPVR